MQVWVAQSYSDASRRDSEAVHEGPKIMSDATHGLPIHTPDPEFGRMYQFPGEALPQLRLTRGWWLVPMLAGGIVGWAVLLRAVFL